MKSWDVFVSHASEDHEVVHGLTDLLCRAGMRVWVDDRELRLGDSLREKIDEGLAASRFGIVVLSPSFLAKRWPQQELNGLLAREEQGEKVILPIWHEIDKKSLASYSPMLADRIAARTDEGIAMVASQVIDTIMSSADHNPAVESPTLLSRLLATLQRPHATGEVRDFLVAHPRILGRALGDYGRKQEIRSSVSLASFELDICVRVETGATTGTCTWFLIQLDSPQMPLFDDCEASTPAIEQRTGEVEAACHWISHNEQAAAAQLPGSDRAARAIVVAGRRELLSKGALDGIRRFNLEHSTVALRTYDWLVDATAVLG